MATVAIKKIDDEVLDCRGGPDEPFTATDGRGGHNGARPDDFQQVARAEGRRGRQLGDVPG